MSESLRNIAFLCTYFTSTQSSWEKGKVGTPIDHYPGNDRYSFHTANETEPFLQVDLPAASAVASIRVRIRNQYTGKTLPYIVKALGSDNEWRTLGRIETADTLETTFSTGQKIKAVRVTKEGFGSLYLAGLDIMVDESQFNNIVDELEGVSECIVVHAPFYGLGGGLSVCATAMGAIGRGRIKRALIDKPLDRLLSYPRRFEADTPMGAFVRDNISKSTGDLLFDKKPARSDVNGSMWIDDGRSLEQVRPVVFLSRDNVKNYRLKDETDAALLQRFYKRLQPSHEVQLAFAKLAREHDLNAEAFDASLGIHIRHGNGELYYSSRRRKWGVKPPSRKRIVDTVRAAIAAHPDINRLIICSDCFAVNTTLKKAFPRLTINFISNGIQKTGAGCNHTESVFDKTLKRQSVSEDDENINSFAEVLLLSRCARLCGGSSYFFNAIVGFSNVDQTDIFDLDNSDRYASVDSNFTPVLSSSTDSGRRIAGALRMARIHVDGLFSATIDGIVSLSYFDETLASGDLESVLGAIRSGAVKELLKERRLY
ncbi:MAG: nodulation protein NodZ [Pseudomonadota bacterium]